MKGCRSGSKLPAEWRIAGKGCPVNRDEGLHSEWRGRLYRPGRATMACSRRGRGNILYRISAPAFSGMAARASALTDGAKSSSQRYADNSSVGSKNSPATSPQSPSQPRCRGVHCPLRYAPAVDVRPHAASRTCLAPIAPRPKPGPPPPRSDYAIRPAKSRACLRRPLFAL